MWSTTQGGRWLLALKVDPRADGLRPEENALGMGAERREELDWSGMRDLRKACDNAPEKTNPF